MIKNIEYSLYGIFFGLLYILLIFGTRIKSGKKHNLNINIPFLFIKNGSIIILDYHIHHWLIFLIVLLLSFCYKEHFLLYFIRSFSLIWIIHGLLYNDCFCFKEIKQSIT